MQGARAHRRAAANTSERLPRRQQITIGLRRDRKEWMEMRGEGSNLANGEQQQICLAAAYAGKRARAVEKTICMKSTKILERHGFE